MGVGRMNIIVGRIVGHVLGQDVHGNGRIWWKGSVKGGERAVDEQYDA